MTDDRWHWLDSTRELQQTHFGLDYSTLQGPALMDYFLWNIVALNDELHEFLGEVKWKPWASGRGEVKDRDAAVDELVDAGHFLANLASALGVTDAEWEERYQAKQLRNAARQQAVEGYDSDSKKCPSCRRELDKPGSMFKRGTAPALYCTACSSPITQELPETWANSYAVTLKAGVQ